MQPSFNWGAKDKITKLRNFHLEVNNIFHIYGTSNADRVPIIKNCFGRESLRVNQTLTRAEQKACETVNGLFGTLTDTFRPQHNEKNLITEILYIE